MKILEGLFAYKNFDDVVATTKDIEYEQESIVRNAAPRYSQLRTIDRIKGYRQSGEVIPDYNLVGYSYLPSGRNDETVIASYHLYQPTEETRGNNELIHYVILDGELNLYSPNLFNLSSLGKGTRDLLEIVHAEKGSFDPINESELARLAVPFSPALACDNSEELIKLISYILYAKENRETLFIYYEPRDYEKFKKALFSALKFLPRSIANEISFITAHGGQTREFDIVGIPSTDPESSGATSSDLYCFYPLGEDSVPERVLNKTIERLFKSFDNPISVKDFLKHIEDLYKNYRDFDEYYNDINMFLLLFNGSNIASTADEEKFFDTLIEYLECIESNYDSIFYKLPQNTRDNLLERLFTIFDVDIINAVHGTIKSDRHFRVVDLLMEFIDRTDDNTLKNRFIEYLYLFLFKFYVNKEDALPAHLLLIEYVFENRYADFAKDELCAFIYKRDRGNSIISTLRALKEKDSKSNMVSAMVIRIFLEYILAHYQELHSPKRDVLTLLNVLRESISLEEIVKIVLDNPHIGFDDKMILLQEMVFDFKKEELVTASIEYFKANNMFVEVITNLLNDPRPNVDFNQKVIDGYIGVNEISNYATLSLVLAKLYSFRPGSKEFNTIKDRIINHRMDRGGFDFSSIAKITIYDADHNEKQNLDRIIEVFGGAKGDLERKLVEAVNAKRQEVSEFGAAKELEDDLSSFRIDLLIRIVVALPEKTSRKLIKDNPRVRAFAHERGYDDVFSLRNQAYAERLEELVRDFFTYENNNPNGGIIEERRLFSQQITLAQKENRFNIRNITSFASALIVALVYGGIFLGLSFFLSTLSFTLLTHNSYLTTYLVLTGFNGVVSFIMTLVNMQNRGRKQVYLISAFECIAILLLSLGLFVLFALLLGGM